MITLNRAWPQAPTGTQYVVSVGFTSTLYHYHALRLRLLPILPPIYSIVCATSTGTVVSRSRSDVIHVPFTVKHFLLRSIP